MITYHEGIGLPIVTTASGTSGFDDYCAATSALECPITPEPTALSSKPPTPIKHNLTNSQ
jgi:hypothetical protein